MIIAIELLIIFIVCIILVGWAIWYRITNSWNVRRYNPENDRGRKNEDDRRGKDTTGKPNLENSINDAPRPSEPERRELLPTTTSDGVVEPEREYGTPSISIGKTKLGFRNPFTRRKQ